LAIRASRRCGTAPVERGSDRRIGYRIAELAHPIEHASVHLAFPSAPAIPTACEILPGRPTLEWLYVMPFEHFEDFSAGDVFAVAQEVAEVNHGCFQGVKACGCFGESMRPSVVVARVAGLWEIEHFGVFS
jgi:hypothetical protein